MPATEKERQEEAIQKITEERVVDANHGYTLFTKENVNYGFVWFWEDPPEPVFLINSRTYAYVSCIYCFCVHQRELLTRTFPPVGHYRRSGAEAASQRTIRTAG